MFLPTTVSECTERGRHALDVIIVTGDTYIDSPFIGAAVIGRLLADNGYRVGIIAQPEGEDIARLGEPRLFWGVTAGSVDSLVANYTATKKKRQRDDFTPGGQNTKRPDRATIVYTNLIRKHFKNTRPIVLGGIEASLRRVAHYDYWSDAVRRSVLFDAKADVIAYGMAEKSILALAHAYAHDAPIAGIRGICYIANEAPPDFVELPSYETVAADADAFTAMFHTFYRNQDPVTACGLCQKHGTRFLVHTPPSPHLTTAELDAVHELPYMRAVHPHYAQEGAVRALDTIRFSLATHRGCYGECTFCAIAVHQGRTITDRSPESIISEAKTLAALPDFKGYILDVGGPTANMYGIDCTRKKTQGACSDKRCLYPGVCPSLRPNHEKQTAVLKQLDALPDVKKAFVASGLRYDLVLADVKHGEAYLRELVSRHVSGQLKVAPEHSEAHVLERMGKPSVEALERFREHFTALTRDYGLQQFLTYYLIAAYPGCTMDDMRALRRYAGRTLAITPEQVQIFTPAPSTYAALMYYTGKDPFTGKKLFVEKDQRRKEAQKRAVTGKNTERGRNPRLQKI